MQWVLLLDFDGTVSPTDVGPFILASLTGSRWIPPNQAWERGELTTPERARQQWALLEADEAAVASVLAGIRLDPALPVLLRECRRRGIRVWIVSDGFDFYIERLLDSHGVTGIPFFANRARWRDGRWELDFPRPDAPGAPAGAWKAAVVRRFQDEGARVVYVGDGLSDRVAAEAADRRFAKGKLAEHCRRHGIAFEPFETLADVHAGLPALLGGAAAIEETRP
jgi:2,3-diketo-5-methylthio-1-phosphopentane phosphatase